MTEADRPTPQKILRTISAFQSSSALKGAIELGLFTAIGSGARSAGELAESLGATKRGVRILCDFLVVQELLEKEGTVYRCSPEAALFLDQSSPAYVGSIARFLMGPDLRRAFSDVAGAVRKGGTLLDGAGTVEPDNPVWIDFARSMAPIMRPAADFIGDLVVGRSDQNVPLRVLDIAAGHGVFGVAIASRHPKARVVALDWPAVLEVATETAREAGVADRHTLLPGDAFHVDYGTGFDVVLLTNFLHHFDPPTCTGLLRRVHGALKEGGIAVTLEFIPNEDRVTPPDQASFALIMLATTTSGDAYTFKEIESMYADAGFAKSALHRMEGPPQSVVVSTK